MRSLLSTFLVLSACGGAEKQAGPTPQTIVSSEACEHARDVVIRDMEDSENLILVGIGDPEVKQRRMASLQARTERVRSRFVEHCLRIAPENAKCIASIDDFAIALREQRAELATCERPSAQDGEAERCIKAADDRMNQRVSPCLEPLERILRAADGQPDNLKREEKKLETNFRAREEKKVEAKR